MPGTIAANAATMQNQPFLIPPTPTATTAKVWLVDVYGTQGGVETCGPMPYATAVYFRSLMLPMRSVSDIIIRMRRRTGPTAQRVQRTCCPYCGTQPVPKPIAQSFEFALS